MNQPFDPFPLLPPPPPPPPPPPARYLFFSRRCNADTMRCDATRRSVYIPGLPDSADKEAVRNLFSGLFEAQR